MNSARLKMMRRKVIIQSFLLIAIVIFIAIAVIEVTKAGVKNTAEVNKQTCEVWGYEEDCKTPLK